MQLIRILPFFLFLFFPLSAFSMEKPDLEPLTIGNLEIWPIIDANVTMESSLLPELANHPEYEGAFANGPLPAVDKVYYLPLQNKKILFDTGWGTGKKVEGQTLASLKSLGITADQITDILLTHMDIDHIGGLLANDEAVFPNATIWISKPEFEAWTTGRISGRREELAKKVAEKYKDRIKLFEFGQEIFPGIVAMDASGHTPGHTAFEITSGDDKLIIGGDFIHIWQIQLPLPKMSTLYDMDKEKAAESRIARLEKASNDKSLLGGMHIPMISRVIKREDGGFNMRSPR